MHSPWKVFISTNSQEYCYLSVFQFEEVGNAFLLLKQHNYNIEAYQTDIYQLKTQKNLMKVFDDVTKDDPCTCEISFRECESSLHRI